MSHEIKPRVETETPTASGVHNLVNGDKREEDSPSKKRVKLIGAGLLGTALLGAVGGVGWHLRLLTNPPEPTSEPTAEAPTVAGETAAPATEAPTSEASPSDIPTFESGEQASEAMDLETFFRSFEISADEYTTPEAISARYVDLYDQWMNAGGTVQFSWDVISNEDKTITDVMAKFDGRITDALYTDSPEAQSLVASIETDIRQWAIRDFYMSLAENGGYEANYELLGSELTGGSVDSGSFTTTNTVHVTDNGGETLAGYRGPHDTNLWMDITRIESVTFVNEEGVWKVDSLNLLDSQNNSHS